MKHAFPEDELRPLNCTPLTRERDNPGRIEVNDPLGNYSLTLVDSLSTLAILASGSGPEHKRKRALTHFQNGVASLVELYGDGTEGEGGQGRRARGFDLDSKVQVFETVIRGVGGLLSAHLFAAGELPMIGYNVSSQRVVSNSGSDGIRWSKRFTYDGQLLRLAHNLATRLLPAFTTSTGIPYPRVNLRYGIPFYTNSPLSCDPEEDGRCVFAQCPTEPSATRENTETCSAGAGSLLLEFIVLSRLTGDPVFEDAAKRAFWSIWERRSEIGLVGSNIDAESGLWTNSYTGLGAGIDSFFEYAFKTYVLLSGSEPPEITAELDSVLSIFYPPPLTATHHDPENFLRVWHQSHDAIKRHLYRGRMYTYPHFIQSDLFTGAARALWMDSLSAFYPGLLALTGDVEEAIESHILFTALWTRYSAMPERWSVATAGIEGGLGWWLGRPEFIESTYHIYRATQDPWYLHVGEMTLKDMKRLCWAPCGLSGLQDVRTGEQNNRMESFFLGETAKYLHLLFDPDHPLNKLDAPFVFSTEGHPLLIPKHARSSTFTNPQSRKPKTDGMKLNTCPAPPQRLPFSISLTAARPDLFHAATLARLDLKQIVNGSSSSRKANKGHRVKAPPVDTYSPTNHTYYPWTLPLDLIPHNGTSAIPIPRPNFDITFPSQSSILFPGGMVKRVKEGIVITSMAGLRLGMIQDVPVYYLDDFSKDDLYRIHAINNVPLGRDEKVYLDKGTMAGTVSPTDPLFTRVQDDVMLDILLDIPKSEQKGQKGETLSDGSNGPNAVADALRDIDVKKLIKPNNPATGMRMSDALRFFTQQMSSMIKEDTVEAGDQSVQRLRFPAISAQGAGAPPFPDFPEAQPLGTSGKQQGSLLWEKIYLGDRNCDVMLPLHIPRDYQVLVLQRGDCSFSEKLANIPSFAPSVSSLQLVVVVSYGFGEGKDERLLIRPLLDEAQVTSSGIPRRNPVPMVMVGGGQAVYDGFRKAAAVGVRRRYSVEAQGIPISNLIIV